MKRGPTVAAVDVLSLDHFNALVMVMLMVRDWSLLDVPMSTRRGQHLKGFVEPPFGQ
jgi:hypothetical protein